MKKLAIIGMSAVIIVGCVLVFWQHTKISSDRGLGQKLAGAWSWEYANIRATYNFAPDGSFTAQEIYSRSKSTNTYQTAGAWHIKDGRVIQTITSDSNKKARVPRTSSGQIVRIDAHEFVVAFDTHNEPDADTNALVLKRVTP